MLELPAEGTSASLRQGIEGRLVELGHESWNIQVIVGSANSGLHLVDKSGIVRQESEHVSPEDMNTHNNNTHVTNKIKMLCNELQEGRLKNEGLCKQVHERDEMLTALHNELDAVNSGLQESSKKLKHYEEI